MFPTLSVGALRGRHPSNPAGMLSQLSSQSLASTVSLHRYNSSSRQNSANRTDNQTATLHRSPDRFSLYRTASFSILSGPRSPLHRHSRLPSLATNTNELDACWGGSGGIGGQRKTPDSPDNGKDLYEFLKEAQLDHYYTVFSKHLKVSETELQHVLVVVLLPFYWLYYFIDTLWSTDSHHTSPVPFNVWANPTTGQMPHSLQIHENNRSANQFFYSISLCIFLTQIRSVHQIKYVTDVELAEMGMSRPEQRLLKKCLEKECPRTAMGKLKKVVLSPPLYCMHWQVNVCILTRQQKIIHSIQFVASRNNCQEWEA